MAEHNEHQTFKTDEIPSQEISDPAALSKNPLISVGMITYNHEPYIAQAIEGVVKQETEYSFELIIGEDCSTDGTMEIVLEYQKKYPDIIRVITSDKNVGVKKNGYRTRKGGRGKYIAFCEGDDYWHRSDKLQKQVDYLESHPECGLVHSDMHVLHQCTNELKKNYKKTDKVHVPTGNIFESYLLLSFICTCTVCFRRSLLTDEIIDLLLTNNFLMGDRPLFLEISKKTMVGYIDESLATYRILEESAAHSKDFNKMLQFNQSSYFVNQYFINKYGCSSDTKAKVDFYYNKRLLKYAFLLKNKALANKAFNATREMMNKDLKIKKIDYFYYFGTKGIIKSFFRAVYFGLKFLKRKIQLIH